MLTIQKLRGLIRREQASVNYSDAIVARRQQIARSWISRMRSGGLIELKHGGPRNFFLVHDAEGNILLYMNLARRMPEDLAVFAIEPRRIEGIPLAHVSIEDMAAFYVEKIRAKQPRGPYLLGGLCAGGVIAYEMASQLVNAGETVELVAMFETATPEAPMRPGRIAQERLYRIKQAIAEAQTVRSPLKRARIVIFAISQKLANALFWEISECSRRCGVWLRFRILRSVMRRESRWPTFIPELSVRDICDSTYSRYKPKPLSISSVVLARAQTGEAEDMPYRKIYTDETFGWNVVAPAVKVVDVEGGHSTMLQERFVDSLEKALMHHLERNASQIGELPARNGTSQ